MDIQNHIAQRPLTSAQARQGVNLMRRMESEAKEPRKLRALRLRVRYQNLVFWAGSGSVRAQADLKDFKLRLTNEELDLVLREDLGQVEA